MSVRIEKKGRVWTVIHNRPEARNAMDPASADALEDAFNAFNADPDAAVAVLWGEGGAFCAGFDLKVAASTVDNPRISSGDYPLDNRPTPRGPMGPTRMELDKPVIAAVAGPAVAGGFEIALWCDIRIMEESAYFGVYCRRWGVPLIDGGTVRLPRAIGASRALDMILTGRPVDAAEALSFGLVNRVVPAGQARAEAQELARQIARFPQACLRSDRLSAYHQWDKPIDEALRFEGIIGEAAFRSEAVAGAARFADGAGRGGSFERI